MDASGSIIVAKQGNEVAMRLRSGAAHAAESFGTLSQVARITVEHERHLLRIVLIK